MNKCNCGAKFTSFPSQHHDWCEVIKNTSEVVLHNFARMMFKRTDDKTINVILKETGQLLGSVDYEYWRGDFRVGIFRETHNGKEARSAILGCLEYLTECIRDDRLVEWRPHTVAARREYQEWLSKMETPKVNPHNNDWDYD